MKARNSSVQRSWILTQGIQDIQANSLVRLTKRRFRYDLLRKVSVRLPSWADNVNRQSPIANGPFPLSPFSLSSQGTDRLHTALSSKADSACCS